MTELEHPSIDERYLAIDDGSTGVETEDTSSGVVITQPFDPTKIQIFARTPTVDLLLKRIDENALDLEPGFQRKGGIWTKEAQSRLIESLLIRIPIPAIYVDATDEDHWLIVDGLQRLTALDRFVRKHELELRGLEFLTQLEGKTFPDLAPNLRRRILETEFTVFMIVEPTPPNVKFNVFKRINTGGLPLSGQEIRHALNQGEAARFLARLAESGEFRQATDRGISDKRMADRECVLRFVAFMRIPYSQYRVADLDTFLNDAMASMNSMPASELTGLQRSFFRALKAAPKIFGRDAFRKRYWKDAARSPINKALFEVWTVNLAKLEDDQIQQLIKKKGVLMDKFIELMNTREFNEAVSQGTGDVKKVNTRFRGIERIIQEVLT